MPKLRVLSGEEVVKIILSFGFKIESQKGSHIKLSRRNNLGERQTLIIPRHKEMDKGTLKAIYKQSLRYIDESELHGHFFTN